MYDVIDFKRHYALNARTINLRMKGDIDMSVVTDNDNDSKESDAEVQDLLDTETDVEIFVVDRK